MSVLPQWATPFLSSRCRVRSACGTWRHLRERPRARSVCNKTRDWLLLRPLHTASNHKPERWVGTLGTKQWLLIIWLEIKDFFLKKKVYLIKPVTKRVRGEEIVKIIVSRYLFICDLIAFVQKSLIYDFINLVETCCLLPFHYHK